MLFRSGKIKTLDAAYFNELYRNNPDPWNFEQSEYEKMKYARTMLMIPNDMYANGFEIGCSNGLLTSTLCLRCQKLLAVDSSSIAIGNAKNRLENFSNVVVKEMEIPHDFPDAKFDLILFSEVGYFLTEEDLLVTRDKMINQLLPGGHLLLVHWTPRVDEFPLTGDQVHALFLECTSAGDTSSLLHLSHYTASQFRMDLFEKPAIAIPSH